MAAASEQQSQEVIQLKQRNAELEAKVALLETAVATSEGNLMSLSQAFNSLEAVCHQKDDQIKKLSQSSSSPSLDQSASSSSEEAAPDPLLLQQLHKFKRSSEQKEKQVQKLSSEVTSLKQQLEKVTNELSQLKNAPPPIPDPVLVPAPSSSSSASLALEQELVELKQVLAKKNDEMQDLETRNSQLSKDTEEILIMMAKFEIENSNMRERLLILGVNPDLI